MRQYAPFFQTLHDETAPVGSLGRGTHYSVLRLPSIGEREDGYPCIDFADIAVIWDEDHDTRVIDVLRGLWQVGVASLIKAIGERKGSLTVLVVDDATVDQKERVEALADSIISRMDDYWPTEVHAFSQGAQCGVVNANPSLVETYLQNIDNLWRLGVKDGARLV